MLRSTRIWLLFSFIIDTYGANSLDCDYWQKIKLGNTYSIANPNYPDKYFGSQSCRWHAVSDSRIRIICNEFDVFPSSDCKVDSFNIFSDSQMIPHRYCGKGNFSKESNGKEMIVILTTSKNTQGGRFHCYFQAIEEDECRCGWKKPTKIVGGKETAINEFPMMVGIINRNLNRVYCGGVIIAHRYILTAAHCVNELTAENIAVIVGEHNLATQQETNATKLYLVSRITPHPLYVTSKNDYDIAVITIHGIFKYTNEIGPVCLPFQHHQDSFGGSFVDVLVVNQENPTRYISIDNKVYLGQNTYVEENSWTVIQAKKLGIFQRDVAHIIFKRKLPYCCLSIEKTSKDTLDKPVKLCDPIKLEDYLSVVKNQLDNDERYSTLSNVQKNKYMKKSIRDLGIQIRDERKKKKLLLYN